MSDHTRCAAKRGADSAARCPYQVCARDAKRSPLDIRPKLGDFSREVLTQGYMNTLNSLSVRQLRRAAEIKEKIHSLESELNHMEADSPNTGIHIVPRHGRRLRMAIKAGILAAAGSRWTRAGAHALVLPVQKLKHQVGGAARAKIAASARSRLNRFRNIEIT